MKLSDKNPVSVDKNILAAKALSIMNSKKLHAYVFMKKDNERLNTSYIPLQSY